MLDSRESIMAESGGSIDDIIRKPSLFWLATEGQRALFEWGTYYPYKFLSSRKKDGDGHPVLVLPGFMASDISTSPLRTYLNEIGYNSFGWGVGRNLANENHLELMIEKVEDLYLQHRMQVSLIGWSLGGVFAREIAKRKPNLIRQIITLGSPFGGVIKPNNALWIYEFLTDGRGTEDVNQELLKNIPLPAPVPTTAIYSKEDGIVSWKVCIEEEDDIHQNIQVRGSHLGLGVNPAVLEIITDRLVYSSNNWQRYSDKKSFRRSLFSPFIYS